MAQRVRAGAEPTRGYTPGKSTHHDAYGNPIAGSYTKRYDANGALTRPDRAYDAYGNPVPATYTTTAQRASRTDGPSPYERTPPVFQQVEDMIIDNFNSEEPGSRLDWQEVEGCWVLRPPARAGPPEAVALFLGGAFVGAAPEITYRLMLEALADRNVLVRPEPNFQLRSAVFCVCTWPAARSCGALGNMRCKGCAPTKLAPTGHSTPPPIEYWYCSH